MDDLEIGSRDSRGHWSPREPAGIAPVFVMPPRPIAFLRWLPEYLLPWNLLFLGTAALTWVWLTPPPASLGTMSWGWPFLILARNAALVALLYGALELPLYLQRRQGARFKYNPAFPADRPGKGFLLGSQTREGILRTFASGVPIWTVYEVLILWAFASGRAPMSSFVENPLWLVTIALLVPLFHHVHFYAVHRLIHVPALYRRIHAVHHRATNPSPWSSLSMHPVEHLLYFSGALIHLLIGSHPVLAIFHLQIAGLGAAVGHIGFHRIELGDERAMETHAYTHYLHHKYFEVNYGEGLVPLDRWFGSWHDGSAEGDRLMAERRARRTKVAKT